MSGNDAINRPGMMKPPGPRLRKHIPLKFVTKHGTGKKSGYAELNLTSMVDMLTILVVFLLQTFSASGELLSVSKNITLPEAINFRDLEQAPIISVSPAIWPEKTKISGPSPRAWRTAAPSSVAATKNLRTPARARTCAT